jgi:hypothetical protein
VVIRAEAFIKDRSAKSKIMAGYRGLISPRFVLDLKYEKIYYLTTFSYWGKKV